MAQGIGSRLDASRSTVLVPCQSSIHIVSRFSFFYKALRSGFPGTRSLMVSGSSSGEEARLGIVVLVNAYISKTAVEAVLRGLHHGHPQAIVWH